MALRRKTTNSGSAAVENAAVLALLVLLITGLFLVLYLSFARVWVKSALYDGLICVEEGERPAVCQREVRKRLSYLPWSRVQGLELKSGQPAEVTLHLREQMKMTVQQALPEELK